MNPTKKYSAGNSKGILYAAGSKKHLPKQEKETESHSQETNKIVSLLIKKNKKKRIHKSQVFIISFTSCISKLKPSIEVYLASKSLHTHSLL